MQVAQGSSGTFTLDLSTQTITQGQTGTVGISLSAAPSSNVTVSVTRTSGNTGLSVTAGSSLTFTASAGIGARPTDQPFGSSSPILAFVWIKPPGESDGDYPTATHTHGDPHCDPNGTIHSHGISEVDISACMS